MLSGRNYHISPRKSIVLFFEENEIPENISSNLVRSYMNRFSIEEERRIEISGVYHLSKISVTKRRHLQSLSKTNWAFDKKIIESAFQRIKFYDKFPAETHIIMGTSLYIDNYDYTLNKMLSSWNEIPSTRACEMHHSYNQLTLLCGWKNSYCRQDEVKKAYFESTKYSKHDRWKTSVNDDLEDVIERFIIPNRREYAETFLYKMLNDDDHTDKKVWWESKDEILTTNGYSYPNRMDWPERKTKYMYKNNTEKYRNTRTIQRNLIQEQLQFSKSTCKRLTVALDVNFLSC